MARAFSGRSHAVQPLFVLGSVCVIGEPASVGRGCLACRPSSPPVLPPRHLQALYDRKFYRIVHRLYNSRSVESPSL